MWNPEDLRRCSSDALETAYVTTRRRNSYDQDAHNVLFSISPVTLILFPYYSKVHILVLQFLLFYLKYSFTKQ
jgi:hypothetical protein